MLARSSSCDITPRGRPIRLAGYVSRTEPVSTILDPIEISALLLECGHSRCLIFSFDLLMVGSELQSMIIVRLVKHGFRPDQIVLLASHTHFAPATDHACSYMGIPDQQFLNEVADAAEGLVLQMLRDPPVETSLEISQGELDHSINRRRYWPFPTLGRTYGFRLTSISMAPNPRGPKNELATILLLRSAVDEKIIGAIWHYTCHPTAVVPKDAVSSDYPGVVRRALRSQFGEIPCIFAQGFCGDTRPNMRPVEIPGLRARLGRIIRAVMSGPSFQSSASQEWTRWSDNMAARVVGIANGAPEKLASPASLAMGAASIALSEFFHGSTPDKPLAVQTVRFGDIVELVALSAEATVEWQAIIDRALPVENGRIRLYVGYLGALFGYLPTAAQIDEGGYEVEGFQPLFGMSGEFDSQTITPAVMGCVKQAMDQLRPIR